MRPATWALCCTNRGRRIGGAKRSGFAARLFDFGFRSHHALHNLDFAGGWFMNSPALSYTEGGPMAFCVVILAIAAIYCLWIARKDDAAMHSLLHGEARSRRENNARWHKRAAVLSIIGMGIALGAMFWR